MKNNDRKSIKLIIKITIIIFVVIAIYRMIPKYPEPLYYVDSYQELFKAISLEKVILIPDEDLLPNINYNYTVYLKSRFSYDVEGYTIYSDLDESNVDVCMFIQCKQNIEEHYYSDIRADLSINGVDVEVEHYPLFTDVTFIFDKYRYTLHFTHSLDISDKDAIDIITNMISK